MMQQNQGSLFQENFGTAHPLVGHGALTAQSLTIAEGQAGGSLLPVTRNTG